MARAKKAAATLDGLFFATPEQKVLRVLLNEPTTTFSLRIFASKLKGIRGLGGTEGLMAVLKELEELNLVEFVDNQRSIRLNGDNPSALVLKTYAALCDLEGLKLLLEPIAPRGVLVGDRAAGRARSEGTYELVVVTQQGEDAKRIAGSHPLGKFIEVTAVTPDVFSDVGRKDSKLAARLEHGVVVWGPTW